MANTVSANVSYYTRKSGICQPLGGNPLRGALLFSIIRVKIAPFFDALARASCFKLRAKATCYLGFDNVPHPLGCDTLRLDLLAPEILALVCRLVFLDQIVATAFLACLSERLCLRGCFDKQHRRREIGGVYLVESFLIFETQSRAIFAKRRSAQRIFR